MPKILKGEPPVHILIVDTNVLWFKDKGPAVNPEFDTFWNDHKALLRMELVVAEVVRDELMFQHCNSGKKLIERMTEHISEFSSITAKKHRHRLSEESMKKHVGGKFERWLNGKDGRIADIPIAAIDWRELYRRAIWRIPPFALDAKNPDNEKGFRDALIYETVVDLVTKEERDVNFAFVSNDFVLRTAVADRLKDQKRFLPFEGLADFSSYIKLTREQLTKEFIGKIVKRAAEKFYTEGDENCLWNKEKIGDKLSGMKHAWRIDDVGSLNLALYNQGVVTTTATLGSLGSLLAAPAVAKSPPRWMSTELNSWYLGPQEFVKTTEARTYHWSTTVFAIRKYVLSDGQVTTDERIQMVHFKVLWKADVKADARFHDIALEETKLEGKEFRAPTPEEVQRYGLGAGASRRV